MIQYISPVSSQAKTLAEEAVKRRKTTFPFCYVINQYMEDHLDVCTINRRDIIHGIIYITFSPVTLSQSDYDRLLDWLSARI